MKTGIDLGYNATKAVCENGKVCFASAVGSPDKARFCLNGDQGITLVSPDHVLVGDHAVTQSRFLNRREDRQWIESNEYLSLFYAAVSELTKATSVDLQIVTGLPVAFYDDAQTVKGRLMGEHRLQREGQRAQLVRVQSVRVIPQPFGSLLSEVLDDRGRIANAKLGRSRVGIIDVGGKTVNLLSVNKLSEIGHETASVNAGGWTLVRAVRTWLSRDYAGLDDLRDHDLADAIKNRAIRFYGRDVDDFGDVVDGLANDLAEQIIGEASKLWNGGATLDQIIVTGGGALLLGDAISQHWPHTEIVSNPVFANAVGYWKLANRVNKT
jgi:plasmid segregation protein ParM